MPPPTWVDIMSGLFSILNQKVIKMNFLTVRELREKFKEFQDQVLKEGQFHSITLNSVEFYKEETMKELERIQTQNNYTDFEELAFYQQKFADLQRALTHRRTHNDTPQFQQQVKDILNCTLPSDDFRSSADKPFTFHAKNTQENHQASSHNDLKSEEKIKNSTIYAFFAEKEKKKPQLGFKSLIKKDESESLIRSSGKGFKKSKISNPKKDLQLKKLVEENKRLHDALDKQERNLQELNQFQKNLLKEEKKQCMRRINELEEEIEELSRDNYKLKEIEKSRRAASTIYQQTQHQQVYIPYVLNTQPNDLNKISQKKSPKQEDEEIKDLGKGINLANKRPFDVDVIEGQKVRNGEFILQDLLNDSEEEPRRINYRKEESFKTIKEGKKNQPSDIVTQFQSFSMARTLYNNSSIFLNASKNLIAIDSITSTRNKVAFFKNSMVIVKDPQIEIAFKKSQLNAALNKVRLIFYINNKTARGQSVNIEYDYDMGSYCVGISEKLRSVGASKQGREVLEIQLISERDLNSVIDAHITIGSRRYDLWVPITFITFQHKKHEIQDRLQQLIIQPDRQFVTYENMAKLMPLTPKQKKGKEEYCAFGYGRSKFGAEVLKLSWWERELMIEANSRIIDFIGFIMHHFK